MTRVPFPDLLVLLPGITGSVLEKDGKELWAPTPGAVIRNLLSFGRALKDLEVADDDWEAPDLGDGVRATRLMPDVHLVPGFWKIDGYDKIANSLLASFDLIEKRNFFRFPYDWRRDNRASAKLLSDHIKRWLSAWRTSSNNDAAKVVLVGHSMGGLISRYYVEVFEGWKDTRAVVTFGTPFYGSLNAIDFLLNGFRKDLGPLSLDLTDAMRSFRSVHQLVPFYRCVYLPDGQTVTPHQAQLPGWKEEWNTALIDFQEELETAARANRNTPTGSGVQVVYRPIVGTSQPTRQSVVVSAQGAVSIEMRRGKSDEGGDGTVPKLSAALSGTEDQRTFAPELHARLQNMESMLAHLNGVLSSLNQVRVEDLRSQATSWLSYTGDDVYLPDEPFTFGLAANSAVDESLLREIPARIRVTNHATEQVVVERRVHIPRSMQTFDFGPLPGGTYTIMVTGDDASAPSSNIAPVSDVFVVAAEGDLA